MARVQLWGWKCERCAHEWVPRDTTQAPKICPKCKSPYWDRPRRNAKPPAKPGRASKGAAK